MNSRTRSSMIKALAHCSLRELPELDNGDDVWIKALALVEKTDGCEYFVDLHKDAHTLTNKVKRDFGPTGAIVRYKAIYPYLYLSSDFMPTFNDKTKDSRVKYLERMSPTRDWSKLSLKELNDAVIGVAITLQLNNIKSNTTYITVEDEEYGIGEETGGDEGEVESE